MYPRSGFVPGEHPPKPPFWKPPFCQPQTYICHVLGVRMPYFLYKSSDFKGLLCHTDTRGVGVVSIVFENGTGERTSHVSRCESPSFRTTREGCNCRFQNTSRTEGGPTRSKAVSAQGCQQVAFPGAANPRIYSTSRFGKAILPKISLSFPREQPQSSRKQPQKALNKARKIPCNKKNKEIQKSKERQIREIRTTV